MHHIRQLERVTGAAALVSVLIILPLVGAMVYEVLSRYLFRAPTSWAYELSYMMMAAIFVMAIGYALKQRQHVSVDFLYSAAPPRAKAIINLVGYTVLFPAMVWLTYALYRHAMRAYMSGETSGISAWNPYMWPVRAILAVGFAVFAVQIFVEIFKNIDVLRTNDGREL